jgi:site-specific recombinase XerD
MGSERDLSPSEALERWLDKQRTDKSESSIQTYYYQLKLFIEWCEENGFDPINELSGWDIDEYELERRATDPAPSTIHNELKTLKRWLKYLGGIGVVEPDLYETIEVPGIPEPEKSDDTKLDAGQAIDLLRFYRTNAAERGTRAHVILELLWHTGCRAGGLLALDLQDIDTEADCIHFIHRPEQGTPLKNATSGERVVGISETVSDVLEEYVADHRADTYDEHGRSPLVTSNQGRPSGGSVRDWTYLATQPCISGPCPHDKDPAECEYRSYHQAAGCPSSRSPHQVRTGAITYMLNNDVPIERVAERVNATVEVIKRHYDKQHQREEMEQRRRAYVDDIEIGE